MRYFYFFLVGTMLISCQEKQVYDTVIRGGTIYDGNGGQPFTGDIAIQGDTIAAMGDLSNAKGKTEIDAAGMAVSPGFINMLSWAVETLIEDGNSQSDIRQGVTLEIFGEGESMGPWSQAMREKFQNNQVEFKYPITWNTLGEYLDYLEKKGVSCNVASFVGATTLRINVIGEEDRAPTAEELDSMRLMVRQAMEEGALGIGTSLIYPPAFFAKTDELVALCEEAAKYGGSYISHMRSEGNKIFDALEELITIARRANIHTEIYHLKLAGQDNWNKLDSAIRRIERARSEGLDITTNMYTYTAGGTGLTATMPPSLQDGGFAKLRERLQQPAIRRKLVKEMNEYTDKWENFYRASGSPENILLVGFKQDSLKKYTGKSLAEVARLRGTPPEETAMDLIVQDNSRVECIYFLMNEDNVRRQIQLPYMSFGSDEGSMAPEGVFLKSNCHPRAYGNFARLLGKYVRDEKVIPLEEAIRRLTSLPAKNLKIRNRGELKPGYFADIVIFDPATISDHATYEKPHQYATGVRDVFVNGTIVLQNGNHTGARPGRFVKGPGYKENNNQTK
jgi:N-acyl-D-aspartate/D-glutamate deacylase